MSFLSFYVFFLCFCNLLTSSLIVLPSIMLPLSGTELAIISKFNIILFSSQHNKRNHINCNKTNWLKRGKLGKRNNVNFVTLSHLSLSHLSHGHGKQQCFLLPPNLVYGAIASHVSSHHVQQSEQSPKSRFIL